MELVRRATGLAPAVVTCGAALSACCAVVGYSLLSFLFLTRYYAPATHHFVRPLHFDYTGYVAVAVAPLSPNLHEKLGPPGGGRSVPGAAAAAILPKSRFLPVGTQVAVHVKLVIPWDHTDLFQVTGELMTNATHVAARSARTYINTPPPYLYRLAKNVMLLPLHVLGWGTGDWVHVDLPLFDAYEDREDAPVAVFRARLASRNTSKGGLPPPPVHKAELHVRLKLGPLQTALFWLRPGLAVSVVLLVVGLTTALGGTASAVGLAVLACLLSRWVAASNAEAAKSSKGGGGGRHGRGRLLPIAPPATAAQPKGFGYGNGSAPYGGVEDAMSYSLAHAQYFRGGGGGGGTYDGHEEDHDQGAGSAGEESWAAAGEAPAGKGGAGGYRMQEQPSEATSTWTGTGSSAVGGHTPPAPASAATPASTSLVGQQQQQNVGARGGSPPPAGRPTPARPQQETEALSATPVSGKLPFAGGKFDTAASKGSEAVFENAELVDEGDEAGEEVQPAGRASRRGEGALSAVPHVLQEGEEMDDDAEGQGHVEDEQQDEEERVEARVAGAKVGASMAAHAGSGGSDLAPQADNVAVSGAGAAAVRRRAGFEWKA